MLSNKTAAIIVAAGSSRRAGVEDKLFVPINGKEILAYTLLQYQQAKSIDEIIVVTRTQNIDKVKSLKEKFGIGKLTKIILGGKTRSESVLCGVRVVSDDVTYIAIADGARPFTTAADIDLVSKNAWKSGAALLCVPAKDTIKILDENGNIESTPPRNLLVQAQTPQTFHKETYLSLALRAQKENLSVTDDSSIFEHFGHRVTPVIGNYRNVKITTPEDFLFAQAIAGKEDDTMRIGHGYDVHRLCEGRNLILGGVHVPFERGLMGHSDADVATHAFMDCLLGALALGDIGKLFPDTDPQYKDADSIKLLGHVYQLVKKKGYKLSNADITIVAQRPKLAPYIAQMQKTIADICKVAPSQINIKATTEEGLGFTGSEQGIAAHAVCMLIKE